MRIGSGPALEGLLPRDTRRAGVGHRIERANLPIESRTAPSAIARHRVERLYEYEMVEEIRCSRNGYPRRLFNCVAGWLICPRLWWFVTVAERRVRAHAQFKPIERHRSDGTARRCAVYGDIQRQANHEFWNRCPEHPLRLLPSARSGFCPNQNAPLLRGPVSVCGEPAL
jgi:hypothetical protein